jgi:serine/threonine protein kinase
LYSKISPAIHWHPPIDPSTQILHSCRYLGVDVLIKDVFLQLLDGVEYCHYLGIYYHRVLKPENIHDGLRIAIGDFGFATTDKFCNEFCLGGAYHMSPGNYLSSFNFLLAPSLLTNPSQNATAESLLLQATTRPPFQKYGL